MTQEKLMQYIEKWSAGPWNTDAGCPVCSSINISTQKDVPRFLSLLEKKISAGDECLLQCGRCGQFYEYTSWMSKPDWGECMEGIVEPYEVEGLYKRCSADVISWLGKIISHDPGSVKLLDGAVLK